METPTRRLYLFRHGPAAVRDRERWPDDRARPLTVRGVERTEKAARGLARLESGFVRVISSPLVRALQTAEIARLALTMETPVEEWEALAPGGDPDPVVRRLRRIGSAGALLLVGHEPDLGHLASRLVGGAGPDALPPLKKAGACVIAFAGAQGQPHGRIESWFAPRELRRLGRKG